MQDENAVATESNETVNVVVESATTSVSNQVATMLLDNAAKLEGAGPGIQLDANYFEFKEKGQKTRGVFAGFVDCKVKVDNFDAANPEYKPMEAVKWVASESGAIKNYICGSVALVRAIKENNISVGTGLEITMTDDKGGNNKKTKLFSVSILDLR